MAEQLTIIAELGDNADLLLAPDQWLENHRVLLQARMAQISEELDSVLQAQRLKLELQQKNLVPLRCVQRDERGCPDVVIRVLSLPEALAVLNEQKTDPAIPDGLAAKNAEQQVCTWECDGYDVRGARKLRRKHA